jgi:hypothetical protein
MLLLTPKAQAFFEFLRQYDSEVHCFDIATTPVENELYKIFAVGKSCNLSTFIITKFKVVTETSTYFFNQLHQAINFVAQDMPQEQDTNFRIYRRYNGSWSITSLESPRVIATEDYVLSNRCSLRDWTTAPNHDMKYSLISRDDQHEHDIFRHRSLLERIKGSITIRTTRV